MSTTAALAATRVSPFSGGVALPAVREAENRGGAVSFRNGGGRVDEPGRRVVGSEGQIARLKDF